MICQAFETTVAVQTVETGVIRYADIPTGQAADLLDAAVGDRVRFEGRDYVVSDAYMTFVELIGDRYSISVDLGAVG